jgi:energy-coupling factor transporter ATP-binding protein EcfA2
VSTLPPAPAVPARFPGEAALDVTGLCYGYPGARPVLTGATFRVAAGDRVAVLGANGSGKSTLLLHTNALLLPEAGRVTVHGVEVGEATRREVRRLVGLVFQDPDDQLFLPTLLEDVAFGPLNHGLAADEAESLARGQLAALGLDSAADRAAHHLSGGEKRLAALATVLVSRPALLVLDEPTAGLDARSRRRVVEILSRREETLLIATHDLEVAAALCGRGVVLAGGRIAADAPLRDLLRDEALLRANGVLDPLTSPKGVPSTPR